MVQATQGDKNNLVGVFKGVDALYIVIPPTQNSTTLVIKTAEAAKAAGIKYLLVISGAMADSTDTFFGAELNRMEAAVTKLNLPHAFFRLPFFVDNYWSFKDTIQSQSSIYSPVDPSKPFLTVVVEDAGKAGAAILANWQQHVNKTYNIVSDCHSYDDVAKAFSESTGKEVKYVRVPYEAAKQSMLQAGLPEWQVDGLFESFN